MCSVCACMRASVPPLFQSHLCKVDLHVRSLVLFTLTVSGMAVVFFPATLDGALDARLLHAAEPAVDTKWVSQIWIRQGPYNGTPTARIPAI